MMPPPENFDHDTADAPSCNPQSAFAPLPCDSWHHYYHYQASAQYLWLAETLRALKHDDEAKTAYERAIFQDHFNTEALKGKETLLAGLQRNTTPTYDKHPAFDLEYRSLIGELPDDATRSHDEGAAALIAGDVAQALGLFEKAISAAPHHSNSYFGRGKCLFKLHSDASHPGAVQAALASRRSAPPETPAQLLELAVADFQEAIRLSHLKHDSYHKSASQEHLVRGAKLLLKGETDLAISDFTKALDLHRGNKQALAARAQAYRHKGAHALAIADERRLAALS